MAVGLFRQPLPSLKRKTANQTAAMSPVTSPTPDLSSDDDVPLAHIFSEVPSRDAVSTMQPWAEQVEQEGIATTPARKRGPRKPRRVTHAINPCAPKASCYFYLPSGELGCVGFTQPLKAKVFATHSGYFVRFPRKVASYKVVIRAFCAVPLSRKRFQFLFRKALEIDSHAGYRDREPNCEDFKPLKYKETRHLRTLIARGFV